MWYIRNSVRIVGYWNHKTDSDSENVLCKRIKELCTVLFVALAVASIIVILIKKGYWMLWADIATYTLVVVFFVMSSFMFYLCCLIWSHELKEAREALSVTAPIPLPVLPPAYDVAIRHVCAPVLGDTIGPV